MSSISTTSKTESYMDNIRKLSSQLKETEKKRKLASIDKYEKPLPSPEVTMATQFRNSTLSYVMRQKWLLTQHYLLRSSPVQLQSNVDDSVLRQKPDKPRPIVGKNNLNLMKIRKILMKKGLMVHKRNQSLSSPSEQVLLIQRI
ncbi:BTE_HP_G0221990.mRNA.1.CDS.1 [Saccharomyces cerevisiae]|nr:BTE_HP_G0221990.mRNA.1.CDS.1 [Saccharomyces cerevisiae]CAI6436032.1 BTE_HP_G0221990.mRNA.1.CDS.1 [Saccharomyces cerevisiae]